MKNAIYFERINIESFEEKENPGFLKDKCSSSPGHFLEKSQIVKNGF